MQYLGGKARIAKPLARHIERALRDLDLLGTPGWEPFMGGGNMTPRLMPLGLIGASDAGPVADMWRAAQRGWVPPEFVSEAEYHAARELPDSDPLHGFVGYGCSFGGKLWGGFARSGARNYARGSARAVTRAARAMPSDIRRCGYERIPAVAWIYCDPPYANSTGYQGGFDHEHFWAWTQRRARRSLVLVSEYDCPVPALCIATIARRLEPHSANRTRVEKLFVVLSPADEVGA